MNKICNQGGHEMDNAQGDNPGIPQATESVQIAAKLPSSCGFIRLNEKGGLEVEFYDHGELAHSFFGNDVSTFYTISTEQFPTLLTALEQRQAMHSLNRVAAQVDWTDTSHFGLPTRVAHSFLDIEDLLEWLKASDLQLHTRTDTWV
jgi:hypothetical protein